MTVEVDVVIPTIGRPSLDRAVLSALDQSLSTRVIVVLDRPELEADVRGRLDASGRVQVVSTPGGVGGAAARNAGLDVCRAPAVAFLDDDDWWEPTSLDQRLATVDFRGATSRRFFAAGAFVHETPDGPVAVPREAPVFGDATRMAAYAVSRKDLRFGRTALQSSTFVLSTDLAREVGWDASLPKHQDWDLVLRLFRSHEFEAGWLPTPTVHVEKDSSNSISRRLDARASLEFLDRHPEIVGRARSDFLAVHVLRAAAAHRSLAEFRAYLARRPGICHPAALAVGLSGLRTKVEPPN